MPGDILNITADFEVLEQRMTGLLASSATTRLKIYPPWNSAVNATQWSSFAGNLANNLRPGVDRFEYQLDANAAHGTYVIVAERFLDFDAGQAVDQTVRAIELVQVGPDYHWDDTNVYTVTVSAWLKDET